MIWCICKISFEVLYFKQPKNLIENHPYLSLIILTAQNILLKPSLTGLTSFI